MIKSRSAENACQLSYQKTFVRERQARLIAVLASSWTRRGRNLLEIGCGTGFFTHFLWESGFDVTAVEHDEKALYTARARLGARVDFHLAALDHLPFEDNSFDYAVMPSYLDLAENPPALLAEAARVAARGVIAVFRNKISIYQISCRGKVPGGRLHFFSARKMVQEICPECRLAIRGILAGPPFIWHDNRIYELINSTAARLPIGAYMGMRLDFGIPGGVTPLSLRIKQACLKPAKAAEVLENQGGATRNLP